MAKLLSHSSLPALAVSVVIAICVLSCSGSQNTQVPVLTAIAPTSQAFGSTGGTGTIAVTADGGYSWAAVSNETWITISSAPSGSGSGTVTYSVAANTGSTSRTGTITVAGQIETIIQDPQISGVCISSQLCIVTPFSGCTSANCLGSVNGTGICNWTGSVVFSGQSVSATAACAKGLVNVNNMCEAPDPVGPHRCPAL